ncbi:MAG: M48 family metalloprotease, partial [Clostridia bacterium]|nr:M48 family metalloprotease [Clostridia bacterium]
EYRADGEAVESGYGEALVSALKKLSRDNFSDLNPHPLIVRLEYDHPTTADRIGAIRRRDAERERDA